MQKPILKYSIILFTLFLLYLYVEVFTRSIELENIKSAVVRARTLNKSLGENVFPPLKELQEGYIAYQNPLALELFLRHQLTRQNATDKLTRKESANLYRKMLETRPSWPYLYSGLAQLDLIEKQEINKQLIADTLKYGPYELKVVKSMSEILFYNWDNLEEELKKQLLNFLSKQNDALNSRIIDISAKFARIYEYCDFLYDKKHVEYAACKRHYWQPLVEVSS
jgi:hypothetical protein